MYCDKCGAEISDRAIVCKNCGTLVNLSLLPKKKGKNDDEEVVGERSGTVSARLNRLASMKTDEVSENPRFRRTNLDLLGEGLDDENMDLDTTQDDGEESTYEKMLREQQNMTKLKVEMAVEKATEALEKAKVKKPSYENMSLSESIIDDTPKESFLVDDTVEKESFLIDDTPKKESFLAEEPKKESFLAEEPKKESFLAEEPKKESFLAEEPKKESFLADEPKSEPLFAEEPKKESFLADEPKTQTVFAEEPKKESFLADEPKSEPLFAEEAKKESFLTDEPKKKESRSKKSKKKKSSHVVEETVGETIGGSFLAEEPKEEIGAFLADEPEKQAHSILVKERRLHEIEDITSDNKDDDSQSEKEPTRASQAAKDQSEPEEQSSFIVEEPEKQIHSLLAKEGIHLNDEDDDSTFGTSLADEIRKAEFKKDKQSKKDKKSKRKSKKYDKKEIYKSEEAFTANDVTEDNKEPVVQKETTKTEVSLFENDDEVSNTTTKSEVTNVSAKEDKVTEKEETSKVIPLFAEDAEEEKQSSLFEEKKVDSISNVRAELHNHRKNDVELQKKALDEAGRRASRRVPIRAEIRQPVSMSAPVVVDTKEEKTYSDKNIIVQDVAKDDVQEQKVESHVMDKKDLSYPIFSHITPGGVAISVVLSIILFLSISALTLICSIKQSVMSENVKIMTDRLKLQERFKDTYIGDIIDFKYLNQVVTDHISGIMIGLFIIISLYLVALLLRVNIANQKLVLLYGALPCIFSGSILFEASANYTKFYTSICDMFNMPEEVVIILCELLSGVLEKISLLVVTAGIVMCAILIVLIIIEVATTPDRAGNQDRMNRVFGH